VTETPTPSDQRPEEGPPEYVHEDTPREGDVESAGAPGKERTGTGNPDAAGADEEHGADEEGQPAA
jgi:hypothetical protein